MYKLYFLKWQIFGCRYDTINTNSSLEFQRRKCNATMSKLDNGITPEPLVATQDLQKSHLCTRPNLNQGHCRGASKVFLKKWPLKCTWKRRQLNSRWSCADGNKVPPPQKLILSHFPLSDSSTSCSREQSVPTGVSGSLRFNIR